MALFLFFWMHATREFAVAMGSLLGLAIFAVVATGNGAGDAAADAAWREAATDLPPVSDRIILERLQARMPGPERKRKATGQPLAERKDTPSDASAGNAASQKAESK
jgi:hypothetical protein